ncbi:MAG TPA: hypothetical protein VGZ49_04970 [Xanthobacteraceae bacterium]|nr:hypothetical protein [Xanthobacteraceae bacterium]
MTVLAASPRAAGLPADHARLLDANINPVTGLATDYLNHFNEAIMMLELAPEMPDCMEDLCAWRPLSYCEHFAASSFKERDLAIAAYQLAEPALRRRLDELADCMNAILLATTAAMRRADPQALRALTGEALARLRALVARAGAVIHGAVTSADETAEADATRAAVDALFDR